MAALSQGQSGSLRIGTFQSVGAKVLPEVMRRFLAAWPHVEPELPESASTTSCCGSSSAASSTSPSRCCPHSEGPFEPLELLRDPYVLLVPADHELGGLARASLVDLGDLTLIGNRACRSTALAGGELVQRGVTVDVAFRSDDNGTVQGLVGAGFGAALVPLLDRRPARRPGQRAGARAPDPASAGRVRLAPGPAPLACRTRIHRTRRGGVRRGRGLARRAFRPRPRPGCSRRARPRPAQPRTAPR